MLKEKNLRFSVCCKFCWRYNLHNFLIQQVKSFLKRKFLLNALWSWNFCWTYFWSENFYWTHFRSKKILLNVLLKRKILLNAQFETKISLNVLLTPSLLIKGNEQTLYLIKHSKHSHYNSNKARISSEQVN